MSHAITNHSTNVFNNALNINVKVRDFEQMGNVRLKANLGKMSLSERAISTVRRKRTSTSRAAISTFVAEIKNSELFGNAYATQAQAKLESYTQNGKQLTGRIAARVLREISEQRVLAENDAHHPRTEDVETSNLKGSNDHEQPTLFENQQPEESSRLESADGFQESQLTDDIELTSGSPDEAPDFEWDDYFVPPTFFEGQQPEDDSEIESTDSFRESQLTDDIELTSNSPDETPDLEWDDDYEPPTFFEGQQPEDDPRARNTEGVPKQE